MENVRKSFIFASGSTCHSAQGCGVDDKITNFDYNIIFLSRISLNGKIHHWRGVGKIENCKLQDRKAKSEIPNEGSVNVDWSLKSMTTNCNYRGRFQKKIERGGIESASYIQVYLSGQRVDNARFHHGIKSFQTVSYVIVVVKILYIAKNATMVKTNISYRCKEVKWKN